MAADEPSTRHLAISRRAAITPYGMKVELEALLERSFPQDGDRALVRKVVIDSLEDDAPGVGTYARDGQVFFSYPIALFLSVVPQA